MNSLLSPQIFANQLINWQSVHGRHDLPWQQNPTPYKVLISEVMLQQTQVKTVINYFNRWMARFPDLQSLALSSEDEVMFLWQGLGYYSRARNLRKAAIYIMAQHNGVFPYLLDEIIKIPGVGPYTAGAIVSFAYDQYGPIVDGNVKRFFSRYFGIHGLVSSRDVEKGIWQLARIYTPNHPVGAYASIHRDRKNNTWQIKEETVDFEAVSSKETLGLEMPEENIKVKKHSNRNFAQGLLDMGALICQPKSPNCHLCPFIDTCFAYQYEQVDSLPTPKPKKLHPIKAGHFLWVKSNTDILLEKRESSGIWGSLLCLPQINESELKISKARTKGGFKHTFTHYKLDAKVWEINPEEIGSFECLNATTFSWQSIENIEDIALPTPIKQFILKNLK